VGTAKTILYEISDNTNQAVGMAIISVAWGTGVIVGPAIGGNGETLHSKPTHLR